MAVAVAVACSIVAALLALAVWVVAEQDHRQAAVAPGVLILAAAAADLAITLQAAQEVRAVQV
jgi:hypothetical protein